MEKKPTRHTYRTDTRVHEFQGDTRTNGMFKNDLFDIDHRVNELNHCIQQQHTHTQTNNESSIFF